MMTGKKCLRYMLSKHMKVQIRQCKKYIAQSCIRNASTRPGEKASAYHDLWQ